MAIDGVRSTELVVQLRVVVRGVSPLIWRRVVISNDATLAELHEVLQLLLGWSDEHLHRFRIDGREYGIYRDDGVWFDEDARWVPLARFGLRVGERFVYEYDFGAWWVHDVRVEQVRPVLAGERVPCCIAGRRAGPPEDCGGPDGFLAWEDSHRVAELADTLGSLVEIGEFSPDVRVRDLVDIERLESLRSWLERDRFDRRQVNRQLEQPYRTEVLE